MLSQEVRENGFSPKASLLWHATDNVVGYAAISRGFRIGGIQPYFSTPGAPTTAPETFKSDSIWNYELGARTDWLDKTLRFDLTGFYERWKDPQTLVFAPGQLLPYLDNVGGVTSKGAEGMLQYLFPLQGLSLSASATYTHAATTESLVANGQVIPAGFAWPLSPKWQTATALAYQHDAGQWTFGGSVTHAFIGKAIYGLSQPDSVFGYQQWDVQFNLASLQAAWLPGVTFTVNNLGDVRGVSNAFHDVTYNDVTYIQPRSYVLRLSGKF
jgi:outer membrane receptor protein involved in Fe transport